MLNDISHTRLNDCENTIKMITNQLDNVVSQLREIANKLHENEKTIVRISTLQEGTTDKLENLEHKLKYIDIAVNNNQEEIAKIKTIQDTRKNLYKDWRMWLASAFGLLGIFISVYDWFFDHFVMKP